MPSEPKQMSLFEVTNDHRCGDCALWAEGICLIKTQEQGVHVDRSANASACYAFQSK